MFTTQKDDDSEVEDVPIQQVPRMFVPLEGKEFHMYRFTVHTNIQVLIPCNFL